MLLRRIDLYQFDNTRNLVRLEQIFWPVPPINF